MIRIIIIITGSASAGDPTSTPHALLTNTIFPTQKYGREFPAIVNPIGKCRLAQTLLKNVYFILTMDPKLCKHRLDHLGLIYLPFLITIAGILLCSRRFLAQFHDYWSKTVVGNSWITERIYKSNAAPKSKSFTNHLSILDFLHRGKKFFFFFVNLKYQS